MCGILGALVFDQSPFRVTEPYLSRMLATMAHRGPDGSGIWISEDRRMGLGHRRLAILDLSPAAAQPMCNEDATLWISYNGEIYNHGEIRAELSASGNHHWKTDHSDTEVILHAYEQWGIQCLHKFRGMFAMALWDGKTRNLYLVRDRIGIKPLYYSLHHGRVVFASEIKALLQDPDQVRSVHEEAFYHCLSFLTTPAPQTLFEGIQKVRCGTFLQIDEEGRTRGHRYWDVWDHTTPLRGASEEEIAHLLLDELRRSVKLRKVSDVPVGVFLSGGIDSSTNAALFAEGEQMPIKTFTIGYDGDYPTYRNEMHYARRMARQIGADHYETILDVDDLLRFLPEMVYLQDEPIADPVCVPVYYVSKLARDKGVTVCQAGEGADELFWGYAEWKLLLSLQKWADLPLPRILKKVGLVGLEVLGKKETGYYERLRRCVEGQPIFWGGAEAFSEVQKKQLLSPRLRRRFAGWTSWEVLRPIRDRFEEKAWEKSHLHWMSYLDLNLRLPELLLMRIDKMSMGVSLEGRVPFLDHKFVELAMSIPSAVKTRNGELKHILKRSVKDLIPEDLVRRKKQGFGVPIHEWLLGRLGERVRQELSAFCRETDFLDRAEVNRLLERSSGHQVWFLLNFALWWKAFIAG